MNETPKTLIERLENDTEGEFTGEIDRLLENEFLQVSRLLEQGLNPEEFKKSQAWCLALQSARVILARIAEQSGT